MTNPEGFRLIGVDHDIDTGRLIARLREGAEQFLHAAVFNATEWDSFAACIHGHAMDINDNAAYPVLKDILSEIDKPRADAVVFYLAIAPGLIAPIASGLAQAEQGPFGLALAAVDAHQRDAFTACSAGYSGSSDGWQDFKQRGKSSGVIAAPDRAMSP
jgi:hypothetical protein